MSSTKNTSSGKTGLVLVFSLAAVLGLNVMLSPLLPSATPEPTLTQLFQCTQPMPGYVSDRTATVMKVQDPATGQQHLELQLDKTGHEYGGGRQLADTRLGAAQYPADIAGVKASTQGAADYCMNGAAPANAVAAFPNALAPSS